MKALTQRFKIKFFFSTQTSYTGINIYCLTNHLEHVFAHKFNDFNVILYSPSPLKECRQIVKKVRMRNVEIFVNDFKLRRRRTTSIDIKRLRTRNRSAIKRYPCCCSSTNADLPGLPVAPSIPYFGVCGASGASMPDCGVLGGPS